MDPMVTVDGSAPMEPDGPTTAERIVSNGGFARATSISVTDPVAVKELFEELVAEFGALDAVVNVAGITRPTGFANGVEEDWAAVLGVHLDGYLNVLRSALPLMAEAGHGRVVGVTSGAGWRPANAGAYSCAKRAVAALTWQIGRVAPPGVTVNALSPIAATRMVTTALSRSAPQGGAGPSTGGLSLASMPPPENLGPIGAYLASEQFAWCSGQIVFSNGAEVALLAPPHLLEVTRTAGVGSLSGALEAILPAAFSPAEASQTTNGATNLRFGPVFDQSAPPMLASGAPRCLIVTDDEAWGRALAGALSARGAACTSIGASEPHLGGAGPFTNGFAAASARLAEAGEEAALDAVLIALVHPDRGHAEAQGDRGWQQILDEHAGITDTIREDAAWVRAATDYSSAADRPLRVLTITPATSSAGRSRGQAAAQLARASLSATSERVTAFAISVESDGPDERTATAELAALLLTADEASPMTGAELRTGAGWIGLASHPGPASSVSYGGPAVPDWLDGVLRRLVSGG
jgi:NAD(P)-dependent dehydrogenase (short-subunit alcohol dehydrogenase family)